MRSSATKCSATSGRGRVFDSIVDAIAIPDRPLAQIGRRNHGVRQPSGQARIFQARRERESPHGAAIVIAMEKAGVITLHVLIEPTSGNTGICARFVAASRGTG